MGHRSCQEEKVSPKAAATTQEQDLGEDDDIGESVGRRGGALMTSGSFTMSSASNRAGNSEELGEDEENKNKNKNIPRSSCQASAQESRLGCGWMLRIQTSGNALSLLQMKDAFHNASARANNQQKKMSEQSAARSAVFQAAMAPNAMWSRW